MSLLLIAAFSTGAGFIIGQLSGGQAEIVHMGYTYLAIMILASPLQLLLGVHADAWRNEGHAGLIALMSAGVTLANVVLNYVLIVPTNVIANSAKGLACRSGSRRYDVELRIRGQITGQALRDAFVAQGKRLSHAQALELIAHRDGARDWNTLHARLSRAEPRTLQMGDEVRGKYLGQNFVGRIVSLSKIGLDLNVSV